MNEVMNPPTEFEDVLAAVRQGDPEAVKRVVGLAYERLRLLAARILRQDFPRLIGVREVDSVVNDTYFRLVTTLESVRPDTPADFFRLAAQQVRWELLISVGRLRRGGQGGRPVEGGSVGGGADPGTWTLDPARLAAWTEFHRRVGELPEAERAVFDQCYYAGLTQAEVAAASGVHPKEVSRRWRRARERLQDYLPDAG